MKTRSFAFALLALVAAPIACSSSELEEDTASWQAPAQEALCSGLDKITQGNPAVFFSPFEDSEQKALCILSEAKTEVVVAHYNIRSQKMLDKLVELKNRGVAVSVVADKDNADESYNTGDDFLEANGIKVVRLKPGARYAIMHLKVAVVDSQIFMTGSFNWNNTAANANDENMLVFRDAELAKKYRDEVLELLGEKPRSVDGGLVRSGLEVHFAPEEKLDAVIKREIDAAQKTVDVAMFTFTMSTVSVALQNAAKRGVKVRMVLEEKQTGLSDVDEKVATAGATVYRVPNKIGSFSAMHDKFAVIDGHRVLTGATNWTLSGTRNNEEDLLVLDSESLALKYRRAFADLLWNYTGEDISSADPALASSNPRIFFNIINGQTQLGDRTVVVGSHPALGAWHLSGAVEAQTSELFPSWAARAAFNPGDRIEYKFVVIRSSGEAQWEPGDNRVFLVPSTGRSSVVEGLFGDTTSNWTPKN